jgi:hypothetical protein
MPAGAAGSSRRGLPNLGWIIREEDEDRQFGRFRIGMEDSALDFLGFAFKLGKTGKSGKCIALKPASQKKPKAKKQNAKAWMRPRMHDPADQIAKG